MSEGKKNLIKISFSAFFKLDGRRKKKIRLNLPQEVMGWFVHRADSSEDEVGEETEVFLINLPVFKKELALQHV